MTSSASLRFPSGVYCRGCGKPIPSEHPFRADVGDWHLDCVDWRSLEFPYEPFLHWLRVQWRAMPKGPERRRITAIAQWHADARRHWPHGARDVVLGHQTQRQQAWEALWAWRRKKLAPATNAT